MRRFSSNTTTRNADLKRRRRLAATAERAAVPERPFLGRGPRYLILPSVSLACGPVLSEIARDLGDETLPIDREVLDQLTTFLRGPDSRLFELNPAGALDEAVRLARLQRRRKSATPIDLPVEEITDVPVLEPHTYA